MKWTLPNQLTIGRVFLSAAFFVLLGLVRGGEPTGTTWLLGGAFVVFVLAAITDVLDGYFARKMNLVSAFGRMVDPIVDKVLVVGSFAMLAGQDYAMTQTAVQWVSDYERTLPTWLTGGMVSDVQPWMVVVVAAREFIISGIRGYSESIGRQFPAIGVGKFKMLSQSFAIGAILFILAWMPRVGWACWVKIIAVWLAVALTVYSGFVYLHHARDAIRHSQETQ
jgi:CDP-diacylglycerol--glycerol-3-phosphate 3-phosphatidyltransferase